MSTRRTWSKGNLHISFSNPVVTPFDENKAEKISNILYFYYDVSILHHTKLKLSMSAYDFPKVNLLPSFIDSLILDDMYGSCILEDYKNNGFERVIKYKQLRMEDTFNVEYYWKLERYDFSVKDYDEPVKEWTEYTITIGLMENAREFGGSNREDFGMAMVINNITEEELLNLKKTAESFCEAGLKEYQKYLYKESGD